MGSTESVKPVRFGVMSDTHGNRALMHAVADLMRDKYEVDCIFHLGDNYSDAEELAFAGHNMRMVPGLWCPEYHSARVERRLVDSINGASIVCAHADHDLRQAIGHSTIVLTGHTHVARIVRIDGSLHINPGHLTAARHRGERASFAVIEVSEGRIRAAIHEASGKVRRRLDAKRDDLV